MFALVGDYPWRSFTVIGEGTAAAYQHALREAQIIAARGSNYHRHGDGGHPLGVAPGCSYAGTGYTWDPNRPGHCYLGELPDSRIVARCASPRREWCLYYWFGTFIASRHPR